MRTPRPLLGIFALALLLPLLLLACGGSDEPTGGRSSERATDEPESRTSSGRTTLAPTSPETDREALVGFYNATGGPNWNDNNNWLSDVPISEWEGVATDGNGRVTELYLEGNQLSGEIPPELGNLAKLKDLDLWRNQLRGEIPLELGSFANLKRLDLGENQLSGEIPPELGNLANLTHLHLAVNQLSGEIPPELGNFANLKRLDLGENRLSGEIPPELGNLANLSLLSLEGNQLSGEIPPELGNLAKLKDLALGENQVSGEIPPELGNLANLKRLDLGENRLSGEIPPELGSLANLVWLYLEGNQLRGEIPPELGNLANLTHLHLAVNQLNGCVPSSLSGRLDTDESDLGGLPFCPAATAEPTMAQTPAETDREALVALYTATGGPNWIRNNNWLSDVPISEWEDVATDGNGRVTELWLHGNQLRGEIPPELGSLGNLTRLDLFNNELSGEIPPELGNLANLTHLHLAVNQLNGCVPSSLSGRLDTDESDLGGLPFCPAATAEPTMAQTPAETDREALVALYTATGGPNWIRNNNWLSDVPISEWEDVATDGNGRVTELWLHGNQLRGEIPPELGSLGNLTRLYLFNNELSGEIPPELGNLANLTHLHLEGNQLNGCVPSSLSGRLDMDESDLGGLPFCPAATAEPTMAQTPAETDREALVALYTATGGPNWIRNNNWLSDVPISEWEGVATDGNGRVTELWLYDNQLRGEIPPELGSLGNLTRLYLSNNELSGEIPPELGNFANLKRLDLGENELSGEIPPELGSLGNLVWLQLEGNQLSGEIPPELGNLANLTRLELARNQLRGEIPPELGNLANLSLLSLPGNQLSGEIPPELGNLANLRGLGLSNNELSGEIPPELDNLANLESLRLSGRGNQFRGCIPSGLEGVRDNDLSALHLRTCDSEGGTGTVVGTGTEPAAPMANGISYAFQSFHVISSALDEYGDHDAECKSRLGNQYRLADWNDLTSWVSGGGSIPELIAGLRLRKEGDPASIYPHDGAEIDGSLPKVSLDGEERLKNGRRHFFISRHDHVLPGYFLAHAHIDNYHISLGSWYVEGGTTLCYNPTP